MASLRGCSTFGLASKIPDLNIVENVWGCLVRKVHADGKQFETENELICALRREWAHAPQSYIQNLVDSMGKRRAKALESSGGSIPY